MTDTLDFSGDMLRRRPTVHRWWARRGTGASMAMVLLTNTPGLASNVELLKSVAEDPDSHAQRDLEGLRLLDLCAGACTVARAAGQLGASVTAIDNHPVPVLIGRAELEYPSRFGSADQYVRGNGSGGAWRGLRDEVARWAITLTDRAENASGDLWLPGVRGVVCVVRLQCPHCGYQASADSSDEERPNVIAIQRGRASCPECTTEFSVREADRTGFEVREVVAGDNTALPDAGFTKMLAAASYPQDVQAILDEPWVFGGTGPILVRYAVTPRQAQIVRSFQESFRSIRDELADLGYSPPHSKAVLTYLALGVASLVDILSTSARWDDQRGGVRGLDRHEWHPGAEFFEVGGILIRSILARRFADIQTVIEAGGQHAVEVHSGDMTALPNADNSFDLVIWDPPFCDNISYDRLALPWTRFLRSVIGDVDADLRWPRDPTISDQPPRFDRSEYEQDLRDAAAEIHRVLRPAGRLGVFWMTRTGSEVADLSEFLQMLEPVGLELVQSFSFSTRSASHPGRDGTGEAQPLLLVFRRTGIAQASHAAAVLEGTREGRKMKVAGLVALLEESLEQEELEDLIPRGFRGTRTERLTEAVMTGVDPQKHLLLISKGELRDYALRCGAKIEDVTSLDREGLASMVFQLLGWRSPQEPPFTIGQALDEALELTDRLRLAHDEDDVRGLSTASFDRIEQVLRFCVVSWSTWLRGDGWQDCAKQLVGRANRLSFGDWYHAFVELPPTFAAEAQLVGRAGGILRRTRAWPAIQAVVAIRNRVAHPEESIIDWAGLRDESAAALNLAIDRLRAADTEGALPRVLRPVDEIRDPLGRITLRLVGHGGRHVEFLMTEQTDLTKAVVVLPSDTNPREVDPAFLDAASIAVRAGVAR